MDKPSPSTPPEGREPPADPKPPISQRLRRALFGEKRDVLDPHLFEHISLVAFLAWVGLGADGLSSSSYGPEEAFKALGESQFLAVFLALATALTVFIISSAYSGSSSTSPSAAAATWWPPSCSGPKSGVVSGCGLLVDYVLTITTSIAAGGDADLQLPPAVVAATLGSSPVESAVMRPADGHEHPRRQGVGDRAGAHLPRLPRHPRHRHRRGDRAAPGHHPRGGARSDRASTRISTRWARWRSCSSSCSAYSLGAGTYTGIEAVSNGLQIMREPRVKTAKRTMVYMAVSLAITAGGIILAYLLVGVHPSEGQTMNDVLAKSLAGSLNLGGMPSARASSSSRWCRSALLFVAAQTGFIDGPRVMANMAHDSWLPHRFARSAIA